MSVKRKKDYHCYEVRVYHSKEAFFIPGSVKKAIYSWPKALFERIHSGSFSQVAVK